MESRPWDKAPSSKQFLLSPGDLSISGALALGQKACFSCPS